MPIYKQLTLDNGIELWFWKISESEAELSAGLKLTDNCRSRLLQMRASWHRHGFLAVRQLLTAMGYCPADLSYNEHGKPSLGDGMHISISHTFDWVCVALSPHPIGIDIEKVRAKVQRISAKFLTPKEIDLMANNHHNLTLAWCIKEACYKIMGVPGLSFKGAIEIVAFDPSLGRAKAQLNFQDKTIQFQAQLYSFPDYASACVTPIKPF